jgi:hypothetical protein
MIRVFIRFVDFVASAICSFSIFGSMLSVIVLAQFDWSDYLIGSLPARLTIQAFLYQRFFWTF